MGALVAAWRTSLRADRFRTLAVIALCVVTGLTGVVTVWWLKVIVDAAARGDKAGATSAALAIAATIGVGMLANASVTRMMFPLKENTGLLLDQRLIALSAGAATIEHQERREYLAQLDVLRREGHVVASVGFGIADCVEVLVEAVATGVVLALVDPVLLVIPLFALPSLWAGDRGERLRQKALDDTAGDEARARHLFELSTEAAAGKELRVYGLGAEVLARHRQARRTADRALDRAARRGVLLVTLGWAAFTIGYGGAIVLVVRSAIEGTATVGEVVLALAMIARINAQVAGAVGTVSAMARTVRVAGRYAWLEQFAAGQRAPRPAPAVAAAAAERVAVTTWTARDAQADPAADPPPPVPARLRTGIELRDVGFSYPGADAAAVEGVSVTLPAGSTVAIVGDNGAGKSTLVKLLCRLYQPTSGHILVDGIDAASFDVDEWRARLSAGFQDFTRFELLAREAVGVGDLPRIDDVGAVSDALARADGTTVVAELADGLVTPLGASHEDGTELSVGQWQKLALARALMRSQPLLLVLDEPTAALDADAEHALFSRYASAARGLVTDERAIVVLVSHRFSTVQIADLIVVMEQGRVVETGTHRQLTRAGGLYAELYELQARSYR